MAGIDAQLQADLADMQGIARQNGKMMFLLTVIDVFFKYALAIPVHSKTAKAFTEAFDQVLITTKPRQRRRFQIDKGKEVFISDFQALMKRHKIQHLACESDQNDAG